MLLQDLILKIHNQKLLRRGLLLLLSLLLILFLILLGRFRRLQEASPLLPTPTSFQAQEPTRIPTISFGGDFFKIVFPSEVETYTVLPATYELFSPEASYRIAQSLGFSRNAAAGVSGGLIYYNELGKSLTLDRLAGTINYSVSFDLLPTGRIDQTAASAVLYSFFKNLGLDPNLLGWQNPKVSAFTLKDGLPEQMASNVNLVFLEFKPNLTLGNRALISLQPNYMRIGVKNQIVGFSFWLPNLDWKSPKRVRIKSLKQGLEDLRLGNILWREGQLGVDKIDLTKVELAYFLEPETLTDFTKPSYLVPVFKFGSKDGAMYVKAEE